MAAHAVCFSADWSEERSLDQFPTNSAPPAADVGSQVGVDELAVIHTYELGLVQTTATQLTNE